MAYRHQNKTRLEVAQEIGLWLLRQLPVDSEIAVLNTSGQPSALAADRGARRRTDRAARHHASRAAPCASCRRLPCGCSAKARSRAANSMSSPICPVPAGRKRPPASSAAMLDQADAAGIYLIDVGIDDPDNFGLGTLRLSAEVLAKNTPSASHVGADANRPRSTPRGGVVH